MMKKNAVDTLLGEYQNVITALQRVVSDVSYENLTAVVDPGTTNRDCKSIQTIVSHVVSSGYSYAGYIRKFKKIEDNRPGKMLRLSVAEYHNDLNNLMAYTCATFESIYDYELEEFDADKKIKTTWEQVYDIEQMMEHAIVHVLRHRRQIEKFKKSLEVL